MVALPWLLSFAPTGATRIEKGHASETSDHLQCIDAAVGDLRDALRGRWLGVRAQQPELDFRRGTALLGPLSAPAIDCRAPDAQKRAAAATKIDVEQLRREIGAFERRQSALVASTDEPLPSARAPASEAASGYTCDLFAPFAEASSRSTRAAAALDRTGHESIIVQIVDLVRLEHTPTAELFVDCVAILDRRRFALLPDSAPRYRLRVSVFVSPFCAQSLARFTH